ncbi:hypothetical protein [uncultured Treponema sp.]|uniref:hypothetical protein n=1 Tax=uncultured Treponema sp. TaxID=162155 RepID=UPI0015BC762A|nr:hypothetical protein [uncultured Treponema sp.]
MKSAQAIKNFIVNNLDEFSAGTIAIGSISLSRYDQKNLCVIVPEGTEVMERYINGSLQTKTAFTLSFFFRGEKYPLLVEKMENAADRIQKLSMKKLASEGDVAGVELGKIEYYYDCGTVENQATGLDVKMTIWEEK